MGFTTYSNKNNPHVAIHCDDCNQIRKRGGHHSKNAKGSYADHETYAAAKAFADSTNLPLKNCSFCQPHLKLQKSQDGKTAKGT